MTVASIAPIDQALLVSEWAGRYRTCPSCDGYDPASGHSMAKYAPGHRPGCAHDEALSERGYPDQAARNAARSLIARAADTTLPPPPPDDG